MCRHDSSSVGAPTAQALLASPAPHQTAFLAQWLYSHTVFTLRIIANGISKIGVCVCLFFLPSIASYRMAVQGLPYVQSGGTWRCANEPEQKEKGWAHASALGPMSPSSW